MNQVKHGESSNATDNDIYCYYEDSDWTLETTSGIGTVGDGNAQGNESNSMNALKEVKVQLEKLKEVEGMATPIIQTMQEKIDESAKEMATRNEEHHKRKQAFEEEHQKKMAKLESKNLEENANFAKEMATLKVELKEKVNWNRVDLVMGKKLFNPPDNRWEWDWNMARSKNSSISISADGLNVTKKTHGGRQRQSICVEKGFNISADLSGPILYYYEVINISPSSGRIYVGLSSGNIPADGTVVGSWPNSFATFEGTGCYWHSGSEHYFEWPNGAIVPESIEKGEVIGCGLLLNPEKGWSIFFTDNGILMGKQIPINPTVNRLYPTISMLDNVSVEANFGDDLAKPFKYDINKCTGMVFE